MKQNFQPAGQNATPSEKKAQLDSENEFVDPSETTLDNNSQQIFRLFTSTLNKMDKNAKPKNVQEMINHFLGLPESEKKQFLDFVNQYNVSNMKLV